MGIDAVNVVALIKKNTKFYMYFYFENTFKKSNFMGSLEFHSRTTALGIPLYLLILSVSISKLINRRILLLYLDLKHILYCGFIKIHGHKC